VHRADGRWRLYAFADAVDPRTRGSRFLDLMEFLASDDSPVRRFTPRSYDVDGVFDVRGIIQQSHLDVDWADLHDFLKPRKGKFGLVDYEKVFTPVEDVDRDIFDLRGIDRAGASWWCDLTSTFHWCCRLDWLRRAVRVLRAVYEERSRLSLVRSRRRCRRADPGAKNNRPNPTC
jgi:hypothetical protein